MLEEMFKYLLKHAKHKTLLNFNFDFYMQPIFTTENVVKCDEKTDDIIIETADISNKFKFFETYKPESKEKKQFRITPPRDGVVKLPSPDRNDDIYIDPDVVRSGETVAEDPSVAVNSHTATKMLSMFRQLEETRNEQHQGIYAVTGSLYFIFERFVSYFFRFETSKTFYTTTR